MTLTLRQLEDKTALSATEETHVLPYAHELFASQWGLALFRLDFACFLELAALQTKPLTFLADHTEPDEVKFLTAFLRGMLKDSKIARQQTDTQDRLLDLFYTICDVAAAVAKYRQQISTELNYTSAGMALPQSVRTDRIKRAAQAAQNVTKELCHALNTLMQAVQLPLEARQLDSAAAESNSNDMKQFLQTLGPSCGSVSVTWTALDTPNLAELASSFHTFVDAWLSWFKIGIANTNAAKAKANYGLKFGLGITEYASRPFGALTLERGEIDVSSRVRELQNELRGWSEIKNQMKKPKVPKGCVDYSPREMRIRDTILRRIQSVYERFGGECIDTPVFELKEVLTGKYGEDSKLIYDLKDQGGEQLGLRYDLTVPFARYCSCYGVQNIKRYHIAKVYRRDEPQINKGRYREFYQCDFDICGSYDPLLPETEILAAVVTVLRELRPIVGDFQIYVSHRVLLDGIMRFCGVPSDRVRAISSAIDKLDKESWETVREEMVATKGLSPEVADKLGAIVRRAGPIPEIIRQLNEIPGVPEREDIQRACNEMLLLGQYLEDYFGEASSKHVVFNVSLARGLDYYTGLIYEAVLVGDDSQRLGSIAAGGRYDELIGMFSGKKIPAVGVSLGIERIFRLVEQKFKCDPFHVASLADPDRVADANKTDVLICAIGGKELTAKKLEIAARLRAEGLRVEFPLVEKMNLKKALQAILDQNVPFGVIFGQSEVEKGAVKVREFFSRDSAKGTEAEVSIEELPRHLKRAVSDRRQGTTQLDDLLFGTPLASAN